MPRPSQTHPQCDFNLLHFHIGARQVHTRFQAKVFMSRLDELGSKIRRSSTRAPSDVYAQMAAWQLAKEGLEGKRGRTYERWAKRAHTSYALIKIHQALCGLEKWRVRQLDGSLFSQLALGGKNLW